MDAELESVPGLGTLTARGLTGGDLEVLGGQADESKIIFREKSGVTIT